MHSYNSYKRSDSTIKQEHTQKELHMTTILKDIFLTHFNVKTKINIVVKICIRINIMVMKGVESVSRAKRKVRRAK